MSSTRSRLTLVGVIALALSVGAGISVSAVAKPNKGGAKRATVSKRNVAVPDYPGFGSAARVDIPLPVGKRFKGKAAGTVALSYQTTGSAAGAAEHLSVKISAPNGRSFFVPSPGGPATLQSIGPLRLTPNSARGTCSTLPLAPCADSNDNLAPPYAGTVGDPTLALFYGVRMKGKWVVTFYDDTAGGTSVLNFVALSITPAQPIS
ncbi:MAG: hypothetical protein M3O25_11110 [Actinomycetota bacterium]|nr:hypothetical protein [Actinomycetota bacterium]